MKLYIFLSVIFFGIAGDPIWLIRTFGIIAGLIMIFVGFNNKQEKINFQKEVKMDEASKQIGQKLEDDANKVFETALIKTAIGFGINNPSELVDELWQEVEKLAESEKGNPDLVLNALRNVVIKKYELNFSSFNDLFAEHSHRELLELMSKYCE